MVYMWNCPKCGYNHVDGDQCPYCGNDGETDTGMEDNYQMKRLWLK